jgi:hypothetical protein
MNSRVRCTGKLCRLFKVQIDTLGRTISRQDMRKEINDFMITVMQEEPLDASLMEFDDSKGW